MEILEPPKLPKEIEYAVNDEKLAIFIGAGVSRIVGCDGWDELAKNLLKRCREEGVISHFEQTSLQNTEKIKLITMCNEALKDKGSVFMDEMKKSLKDEEVGSLSISDEKLKIYKDLKNMGNIFITTNADRYFDKFFDPTNIVSDVKGVVLNKHIKNRLYKIHGCISDEKTLVFKMDKYIERYASQEFNQFIKDIFGTYTVLFVGYSLSELELLKQMQGDKTHFCLKGFYDCEDKILDFEKKYFKDLKIELIKYSKDKKEHSELIGVIDSWNKGSDIYTQKFQNNFSHIDDALRNPNDTKIRMIIQEMQVDKTQAIYFFSEAHIHKYQKLYLWLELLNKHKVLSLNKDNEFKYEMVQYFLEIVSIQNKNEPIPETTDKLLSIVNRTIEKSTDKHIILNMIKVLFNLPVNKITLKHIDFIYSYIKEHKHSVLAHNIERVILPVLLENNMREHLISLLNTIFGWKIEQKNLVFDELTSIIEQHNLQGFLKTNSKSLIESVGIDGLKVVIKIAKDIIKKEQDAFNDVWISVIRTKTDDEIKQNQHSDRYETQLIFFIRDLLKSLPASEIKPYIKDFLQEEHLIFARLALYAINEKYDDLKDIFWQWQPRLKVKKYKYAKHELWVLLDENSDKFTNYENDKIIKWIESLNCKNTGIDINDAEKLNRCNAYMRKEWLLCLKGKNTRANELYIEYDKIYNTEIKHPGFSSWSSGFQTVGNPHPIKNMHEKSISEILHLVSNFDPESIKEEDRGSFDSDEDLVRGVADDLSSCVKYKSDDFSLSIDEFKNLDYVYKYNIIQGFCNAWKDKQKFDWGKVLNFIENELTDDLFTSDDRYAKMFVGEIANLIEAGTKRDNNAFDEEHIPATKTILFKLLENKYEETENSDYEGLISYVLNSANGKTLLAFMNYVLRYGRLNSSIEIKWDADVKDFFTKQLEKNDVYSGLVFTILGSYLENLRFLDNEWVIDNFNKIFPLDKEKLWVAAITAYFFYSNTVYMDTYLPLRKHILKALRVDFKQYDIKSRMVSFVYIAYINDEDDKTIYTIIKSKNIDDVLMVIHSVSLFDDDKKPYKTKQKIKKIWYAIYELYKDDDSEDSQKIFLKLTKWFVFLDKVYNKDMLLLKHTVRHTKSDYQSHKLMKEMARLSSDNAENIGEIYEYIIDNDIFPDYERGHIFQIIDNLDTQVAQRISNKYISKDLHFITQHIQKNQ